MPLILPFLQLQRWYTRTMEYAPIQLAAMAYYQNTVERLVRAILKTAFPLPIYLPIIPTSYLLRGSRATTTMACPTIPVRVPRRPTTPSIQTIRWLRTACLTYGISLVTIREL